MKSFAESEFVFHAVWRNENIDMRIMIPSTCRAFLPAIATLVALRNVNV